jgi:hypothetical protein
MVGTNCAYLLSKANSLSRIVYQRVNPTEAPCLISSAVNFCYCMMPFILSLERRCFPVARNIYRNRLPSSCHRTSKCDILPSPLSLAQRNSSCAHAMSDRVTTPASSQFKGSRRINQGWSLPQGQRPPPPPAPAPLPRAPQRAPRPSRLLPPQQPVPGGAYSPGLAPLPTSQ